MIIVIGSLKGGTGKSTISFHIACQAFLEKHDIVTVDIDAPQFTFTKYYNNRKNNKNLETWQNHESIKDTSKINDFIANIDDKKIYIIDTPGRYDEDVKQIHKIADIIITPINDSALDIDTIMQIEKNKWSMPGYYCEMVFANKSKKPNASWFVVRNRCSSINSKNKNIISCQLDELALKLNYKIVSLIKERVIFKELFVTGETIFDMDSKLSISNITAKIEMKMIWHAIMHSTKK